MQLKEFSLINPIIESSEVFKAIETAIPSEMIEQAIATTNSQQQRQRKLPSGLMISLVIAMSLWSSVSMRTVLKNLVNGLSQKWIQVAEYWQVPNSGSISEARQRLGCAAMTRLFELVARPMASPQTESAFIGGLRVMAVDGTVMDVPDSAANARVFGYPGTKPGTKAAFPKVRLVLLIETGTHLIIDALICPYRIGERVRIQKLLRSVTAGMLLIPICDNISTPFFLTWLLREICDEQIPARQGRSNPRVIKKTRSKFPAKKPFHRGTGTQRQSLNFSIANTA